MSEPARDLLRFLCWTVGVLIASCLLVIALVVLVPDRKRERTYTVEIDGVKYENLKFVWGYKTQAAFETKDGKRVEVNGTFAVIEQ